MDKCHSCFFNDTLCKNERFATDVSFPARTVIFDEGTPLKGIFCVKKGVCKISKLSENGKELIIQLLGKGTLLGIRSVVNDEKTNLKAVSLSPIQACFLPIEQVRRAIQHSGAFASYLVQTMASHLKDADNRIVTMGQHQAHERLATLLIYLNDTFGTNISGEINVYLKRSEMASFIGTATESMIRIFKKFEQSGLVTSEGRAIRILDEERLFNIANGIEHSVL